MDNPGAFICCKGLSPQATVTGLNVEADLGMRIKDDVAVDRGEGEAGTVIAVEDGLVAALVECAEVEVVRLVPLGTDRQISAERRTLNVFDDHRSLELVGVLGEGGHGQTEREYAHRSAEKHGSLSGVSR